MRAKLLRPLCQRGWRRSRDAIALDSDNVNVTKDVSVQNATGNGEKAELARAFRKDTKILVTKATLFTRRELYKVAAVLSIKASNGANPLVVKNIGVKPVYDDFRALPQPLRRLRSKRFRAVPREKSRGKA